MTDHQHKDWFAEGGGGLVRALCQLVNCRSDNPGSQEKDIASLIVDMLRQWTTCEVTVVDSMPGRPSLAAVLRGSSADEPTLVVNGHIDTVPVDDMTAWSVPPFSATVKDGRVYGRGTCDMKAGLAAQLALASMLSRRSEPLPGTLVLHFAAGEECAEPGTSSLLEAGFGGDYGIVTEPTGLAVASVARGLAYFEIRIEGRSVHSSRPASGVNPISAVPRVLDVLDRYAALIATQQHSLLPSATTTPTIIRGGGVPNMLPDVVRIVIDRRLLPHEDAARELDVLRQMLSQVDGDGIRVFVDQLETHFVSADATGHDVLGRTVREEVEAVTGQPTSAWGTPYSSDMRVLLHEGGMEAVTFGPGSITEAHAPDEFVEIDQLVSATHVLLRVTNRLLGGVN